MTGQHKTQTYIHLRDGLEPTIPMFERSKTMRALDRAATGTWTTIHCVWNQSPGWRLL